MGTRAPLRRASRLPDGTATGTLACVHDGRPPAPVAAGGRARPQVRAADNEAAFNPPATGGPGL